ncbi:MAG TPA: hypothetical protein VIK27_04425 [Candidatus Aquilonibacter sp.]
MIIVGTEVSGDHIAMTKAAVERSGVLVDELVAQGNPSPTLVELENVNEELSGVMMVIDTLSHEMSTHMSQATTRVSELNEIATALTQLVTGEAGSGLSSWRT